MSYRPVVRICAAAAFTVLIGAGLAVPASAAESEFASPEVFSAMQRDLGLTAAEVEQRLAAEATAATLQTTLSSRLGDTYAGSWTNEAGQLVVGTTDAARTAEITAAGAVAQVRPNSFDELDTVVQALNSVAALAPVGTWYADPAASVVVLETTEVSRASEFVSRIGALSGLIRVDQVAEAPQTFYNLVGGNAIYSGGGRCSIGFSARSGSTAYVVTAGHCTEGGGTWSGYNQVAIGPVAGTSFPGNDYGIIRVNNQSTWTPTSQVAGTSSVTGSTVAAIGSSTCRSGSTTGYRCGTIQAYNATVNYGGGDVVYGLTRTTACAEPGDSGGSFVSGRQAQGMTSGGSGNCSVGGTTFFQPLREALNAYGLTLVTG